MKQLIFLFVLFSAMNVFCKTSYVHHVTPVPVPITRNNSTRSKYKLIDDFINFRAKKYSVSKIEYLRDYYDSDKSCVDFVSEKLEMDQKTSKEYLIYYYQNQMRENRIFIIIISCLGVFFLLSIGFGCWLAFKDD